MYFNRNRFDLVTRSKKKYTKIRRSLLSQKEREEGISAQLSNSTTGCYNVPATICVLVKSNTC